MTVPLALGMPNGIEWVVILFVVLILFGAKRLPELARGLGKSMSEFKKAREDFETELHHGAASVSSPKVSVEQPADRQLAYSNAGQVSAAAAAATGGNIEQQVRELQEQLREVQRQNQLLQASAVAADATHHPLPTVATPGPAAAPATAHESVQG